MKAAKPKQVDPVPEWMLTEDEISDYFARFGPVRILVTGSDDWTNKRAISGAIRRSLKFLRRDNRNTTILCSGNNNADVLARSIGSELGIRAEYNQSLKGSSADSRANILLAFIKDGSPESTEVLNSWLEANRPAIVCRQEGLGPVRGEFINMDKGC